MRIAKVIGEDQNPCMASKIGVVIVNPVENKIVGTGYNGPPKGTPHCDTRKFLEEYVWPQLTQGEQIRALGKDWFLVYRKEEFLRRYAGCGQCPRRIVGAKSGERLELCSCEHAERNAIYNSTESLSKCEMFCWCGGPCVPCTRAIINKQISVIHCLNDTPQLREGQQAYRFDLSEWLLNRARVKLIKYDEDFLLT